MSRPALRLIIPDRRRDFLPIEVGDVVRTGENRYPSYRVVAMSGDRAWVRDVQYGTDHVVPLTSCQKV